MAIKGLSINEGFTDLGTVKLSVNNIEEPVSNAGNTSTDSIRKPVFSNLFKLQFNNESHDPVTQDYKAIFTLNPVEGLSYEYTEHPNETGFIRLDSNALPVVLATDNKIIRIDVTGALSSRLDEAYLKLPNSGSDAIYTQITDLVLHNHQLCVYNPAGEGSYLPIQPVMTVKTTSNALLINEYGKVFEYHSAPGSSNSADNVWIPLATNADIKFYKFPKPGELIAVSDGFYKSTTAAGTAVTGVLGDSNFSSRRAKLLNPDVFEVKYKLLVYDAGDNKVLDTTTLIMLPGSKDFQIFTLPYPSPPEDKSPLIVDVSGDFSATFRAFLQAKNFNRLKDLQKAGPIYYINGFPASLLEDGKPVAEVRLLQSHVDLYNINPDLDMNKLLVGKGYNSVSKIGGTPKNIFIDAFDDLELSLIKLATTHEVASQLKKYVGERVGSVLADYKMKESSSDPVSGSDFAARVMSGAVNSCGCSDCKSNISPFAYLMELIKYAAEHVDYKVGSTLIYGRGIYYEEFIELMETVLFQRFGALDVSCETLHDEYCRVRLVTEVLEAYLLTQTPTGMRAANLVSQRKNFLLSTYRSLLSGLGTSETELRDLYVMVEGPKKEAARVKLAEKIGIVLYPIPPASPAADDVGPTVDKLWLAFTFATSSSNYLSAVRLEKLFGFRDTQRDVSTLTPVSKIALWRGDYLRKVWTEQDYLFTNYSRENVIITNPTSFKANWQPILDPDIMGWEDMAYRNSTSAATLWLHRKENIDTFLKYYASHSDIMSTSGVDFNNRILKVKGQNILSQQIYQNKVYLTQGSSTPVIRSYTVRSRALSDTDTNVYLNKSTPADPEQDLMQPNPFMFYDRKLTVPAGLVTPVTNIQLTFPDPVFEFAAPRDWNARLWSDGSSTVYDTADMSLTGVTFIDPYTVNFTVNVQPSDDFCDANIYFTYTCMVPLVTVQAPDPVKIATRLFTKSETYTTLMTTPNSVSYSVFSEPNSWPFAVTSTTTHYEKLVLLYKGIISGTATDAYYTVVTTNLHSGTNEFIRMMQLMSGLESYLAAIFTAKKPEIPDVYELASIFRNCSKSRLRATWVTEELTYPLAGTTSVKTMLDGRYFWKSITEPVQGPWDPSLQTIPPLGGTINATHVPVIEPDLLAEKELRNGPAAQTYRSTYYSRKASLKSRADDYRALITPYNATGFTGILNNVSHDMIGIAPFTPAYTADIAPYADLNELASKLGSVDPYIKKKAADIAWTVFRLSPADLIAINDVKKAYENNDPLLMPSAAETDKAIAALVTGYKLKWFYNVWIAAEMASGAYVYYYNVMKMRMAPGRADSANRLSWQRTLEAWNRQPAINPDIVPAQYVKNFVPGDDVYEIWNDRQIKLETLRAAYSSLFDVSLAAPALLVNYQKLLSHALARTGDISTSLGPVDYLSYFTALADKEKNREDILPWLAQYGITITEYRMLSKIYAVLKEASSSAPTSHPLFIEEGNDVVDILMHINATTLPFNLVQEEYTKGILLSQDCFILYEQQPNDILQSNTPVYNKWRSPYNVRKEWEDVLETRVDREIGVNNELAALLQDAEDTNMPLMRDAIIAAVLKNCEKFPDGAERLAKTFFVETKDNCCVKHTRVSFAIETIQGLMFALRNGIYDENATGFALTAPNIATEWDWIGSYATWRAATFVFIYPENLLYPTLKKIQSPAFKTLADRLQSSTRFSAIDACNAAKEYQAYLDDVQNMEIICSTNTEDYFGSNGANDCCDRSAVKQKVTYYFGLGKVTGKTYISSNLTTTTVTSNGYTTTNAKGESYSFWEPLNIPAGTTPIGGYVLGQRDSNWYITGLSLWYFYTYTEKGEIKMAYIKRMLTAPNTRWSDPVDMPDFPEYTSPADRNVKCKLVRVIPCQQGVEWMPPCFVFIYKHGNIDAHYSVGARYRQLENRLELLNSGPGWVLEIGPHPATNLPFMALQYHISQPDPIDPTRTNTMYGCFTMIFAGDVVLFLYDWAVYVHRLIIPFVPINRIILWVFQSRVEPNTLIMGLRNSIGVIEVHKIILSYVHGTTVQLGATVLAKSTSMHVNDIEYVYPSFWVDTYPGLHAYRRQSDQRKLAVSLYPYTGNNPNMYLISAFRLCTDGLIQIPIQSDHCTVNIQAHRQQIQACMTLNSPGAAGTIAIGFDRKPPVTTEYLYEAYYYVPMLLALDQQQRGQYESALSWYRSVYDYTENLAANRKIFYGLKLEETITNNYDHAVNWLLDPLNPHLVAKGRKNAYTKYTLSNIIQCLYSLADREFTMDTIETVPNARKLYSAALELLKTPALEIKANSCEQAAFGCLIIPDDPSLPQHAIIAGRMARELAAVGDESAVDEAKVYILERLSDSSGDSFTEKIADGFAKIRDVKPGKTSKTVTQTMSERVERDGEAYQYIIALDEAKEFTDTVSHNFKAAVADTAGILLDNLDDPDVLPRIRWLGDTIPQNREGLQVGSYEIVPGPGGTQTGQQHFTSGNAIDPLHMNETSWNVNFHYNNPNVFVPHHSPTNQLPYTYTPIIDFAFCMPQNPVYQSLLLKGNLELYKIFNCRNIAGMVRELNVYAAATDSITGMPVIGAGGTLSLPGINNYTPSNYRFRTLMERAKQLAQQSQQLESMFLAALEKEDAENYSQMKARQDLQTAKATVKLQDLRVTQANDEVKVADLQLDKVQFTKQHFDYLLTAGTNHFEDDSLDYMRSAQIAQVVAAALSVGAGISYGVAAGSSMGPSIAANVGASLSSGAGAASSASAALSTQASIMSQMASYIRRAEEWEFQSDLASKDIGIAGQQRTVAQDSVRIASQERDIAQMNTDHAQDSYEFLKNKFTNAALYNWMGNVLERCYSYMLNLSTSVAKTAERQLYFERQEQAGPFILDDYWESPAGATSTSNDRRGLTGSARLMVDITRLEQFAFDSNKRKLQMSKVISLGQNFPSEFQRFKETGVLNFELTNKLFDYDFPGHYLRLINSVKTTVVGLVPVYDSIKASLTAGTISYTVIGGTTFQNVPIRRMELDSVALTSSSNATGMFELQPAQNELLNPFEGMGIESRWEFKMPHFSNRMDYSNIADVLINVEYTAFDSYQYRYQVLQNLNNRLTFNRGFSFKNDFPDQWYELGEAIPSASAYSVTIELKRDMFPQGLQSLKINTASPIVIWFVREDGYINEIENLDVTLVTRPATVPSPGGKSTTNGKFLTTQLMNALGSNPGPEIKLMFTLDSANSALFSNGKITDIFMIIPCKAELKNYPL